MFDLDQQIGSWRQRLAQAEVYSQSDLDELEAHLRDEVAALARLGLSEQEAFTVACMRMGGPNELNPEFAKVNGAAFFRRRLFWMVGGILGVGYANLVGLAASKGAAMLWAAWTGVRGYTAGIIAQSVYILTMVAIIMGVLIIARQHPGCLTAPAWLRSRRGRAALFAGLVTLNGVLTVFPYLLTAGMARILSPRDLGEIALVTGCAGLGVSVAWSCLLLAWMVKAWTSTTTTLQS